MEKKRNNIIVPEYHFKKAEAIKKSKIDKDTIETLEKLGFKYIGLSNNEEIGFYYDPNIKKYVIGSRCDNFYFGEVNPSGISMYMSRYLDFEEGKKPYEVEFSTWIHGVLEQIFEEYKNK